MGYDVFVDEFGTKRYKYNKVLHREDGPAVEYTNGDQIWYIDGKKHRLGGPAVIYTLNGKFCFEWWVDGKRLSSENENVLNSWWDNKNGI